jgi:hypothetical protein
VAAVALDPCARHATAHSSALPARALPAPDAQFRPVSIGSDAGCEIRAYRLDITYSVKQRFRRRAKALLDGLGLIERAKPEAYNRAVMSRSECNELIYQTVIASRPALFGRIGATELRCVRHFLEKRQGLPKRSYPAKVASRMRMLSGFFPTTEDSLDAFCREYLLAASEIDVLGVWYNPFEEVVANQVCPGAKLAPLQALEPYVHAEPWSRALAGKTVLVIHPFADSIRENFERNRSRLFENGSVLPPFELRLIRAVQSIAGQTTVYATWFDALEHMKARMDAHPFDVCIVGAGAYGLPLAAHAKRIGRISVHLGGATQILFGVKGRRWDASDASRFYNQWWVRPTSAETPSDAKSVEGGCYW